MIAEIIGAEVRVGKHSKRDYLSLRLSCDNEVVFAAVSPISPFWDILCKYCIIPNDSYVLTTHFLNKLIPVNLVYETYNNKVYLVAKINYVSIGNCLDNNGNYR